MDSKAAFVHIIQENEGVIYKIVRAYAHDIEQQKDLYQEVVYQLWKSFDQYRGDARVSTWIYRVALNSSITFLNKGKRKPKTVELKFEHDMIMNTEVNQDLELQMIQLYQYIRSLNLIDRGIILLYLEGTSYEAIGEIMGFSASNIGTRLGRIKDKMKKKIKN